MTRKGKLIPSQGTPPSACHHGQHAHSKEGQWDGERWVVPFTSKLKQLARSCRLPLRSFCYSHFLFPIMTGTYGVYNLASVLCIHNETTLKCCNGFSLIWRSVCQPRPTKDTHPWSFTSYTVIHFQPKLFYCEATVNSSEQQGMLFIFSAHSVGKLVTASPRLYSELPVRMTTIGLIQQS